MDAITYLPGSFIDGISYCVTVQAVPEILRFLRTHGSDPYSWRNTASSWESDNPRPRNMFTWDKNIESSS